MSVVGIDLGTDLSKVAVAWRKRISVVPNELTKLLTPTLTAFTKKERYFGDAALGQSNRNYKNTIAQVKRYLGRQYDDPKLQEEIAFWLKNKSNALSDGRIGIEVETSQGIHSLAAEQILAGYLQSLKKFTCKYLDGIKVRDCVISCPAYFDDAQRRALLTGARLAELNVLRILNESTAIALNYGIVRNLPESDTQRVIFVDIGYANTQVAVVDFVRGKLTMRYTTANPYCGGRDFDRALFDYFANLWLTKYNEDITEIPRASVRLIRQIKKIKKVLSGSKDAEWCIDCFNNDRDFVLKVSREEFEELSVSVLKGIQQPILEALEVCATDDILLHSIELVGAVRSIPMVQESILATIQASKIGAAVTQLSFTLNGDESVARGCALMCAMLSPNFRVKEFQVADINTWPITITYPSDKSTSTSTSTSTSNSNTTSMDTDTDTDTVAVAAASTDSNSNNNNSDNNNKEVEQLVIRRGNPSPCTAKVTFSKTSNFSFTLRQPELFKNKSTTLTIEYPFRTNLTVGEFHIQMLPLNDNAVAEPKIKLMLSLNRHGVIDWPQASLIEWVKRAATPEPPPPKATEAKVEAKTDANTDAKADANTDEATADESTATATATATATTDDSENKEDNENTNNANTEPVADSADTDAEMKDPNPADAAESKENNDESMDVDASEESAPNAEAKASSDESTSATADTPTKKPKKKKEKSKVTRNLMVTGTFSNMINNETFNAWEELETNFANVDRIVIETNEAKNDLETYIYDIRAKVNGDFSNFMNTGDSEAYLQNLMGMEDWLYEDGENANKTQYFDKLAQLKAVGDPVGSRWWEAQHRPNRVLQFKKLLSRYLAFVESTDPKYEHIDDDKRKIVRECVTKADEWIGNKLIQQDRRQVYDNPSVRCSEIDQKYREIHAKCESILNTPKPPPPPPKPKEEPKPTEAEVENNDSNNNNNNTTTDANTDSTNAENTNTIDTTADADAETDEAQDNNNSANEAPDVSMSAEAADDSSPNADDNANADNNPATNAMEVDNK